MLVNAQITQQSTWYSFKYELPESREGQDILVVLSKNRYTEPALFIGSMIKSPTSKKTDDRWNVSADYIDVQGFAANSNTLTLRIPHSISKLTQNIYLGVYKHSTNELVYSISSSYVESSKCEKSCENGGRCVKGACDCKGFNYISKDCNFLAETLTVDKEIMVVLDSNEWEVYRVALSDNEKNLKLSLSSSKNSGMRVFQYSSENSLTMPSMIYNLKQYALMSTTKEYKTDLQDYDKAYWLWSFYCDSPDPCSAKIKIYQRISYTSNYLWIIIASVISLGVFCILTPVIIKIVFAVKRRRLRKIADIETITKKKAFLAKYPELKFNSQVSESCTICLEDLKPGSSIHRLACDHSFHSGCIIEWYMSKPFCPLCKREIMGQSQISVENMN